MTRRIFVTISGPRYCSIGGAFWPAVANTSPARTSTRSCRGPCWSGLQSAGMPPLPPPAARELAGEVIGPIVIDADDLACLAALLEAQERAAMRAAVLEGVDFPVPVARHHHRHVAEVRRAKRLGPRQLRFQAQECPGVAAEYARLLLGVKLAIGIDPVGDPGEPLGRPAALIDVHAFVSRRPRRPPQWAIARAYSSFTLAALITLFQRSTSSRMKVAVSAGVPPTGSADRSSKRLRISGCLIASAMSALSRATIGAGVLGGATTANQAADANPGSVSAIVGTSGSAVMRLAVPTAISLSWPPFTRASETPRLSNMTSTSPASSPCSAGAEPR